MRRRPPLIVPKKVVGNVSLQFSRKREKLGKTLWLAREDDVASLLIAPDADLATFKSVAEREARGLALAILKQLRGMTYDTISSV